MAKNLNLNRDTNKQFEYKTLLENESISQYGTKKCYACHKSYKGLIASHIKPYKLCVLDNDTYSQFNINNGLLLAKHIDDYFDKLEITFDNQGKIICSENVSEEIKKEFAEYQLDEKIYNSERKQYMQIHRSIFLYKHYIAANKLLYGPPLGNISVPFYDCGIKIINSTIILCDERRWIVCPLMKLKQEFISRTHHNFKYYISNADLFNILIKNKEYLVDKEISPFLNTPTRIINMNSLEENFERNFFTICSTSCDIKKEIPQYFLKLLEDIFDKNNTIIENFQKILGIALKGEGYKDCIILCGNQSAISILMKIVEKIFGTYFLEYNNNKVLYKKTKVSSIPNTSLLYFKEHNANIDNSQLNQIIKNELFPKTVLNTNSYTVFISNKQEILQIVHNSKIFKFNRLSFSYDLTLLLSECDKILNWIIEGYTKYNQFGLKETNDLKVAVFDEEFIIEKWLNQNCIIDKSNINIKTRACDLFEDFKIFSKQNNQETISERKFYIVLSRTIPKKRTGQGIFYIGILLKNISDSKNI